MSKEDGDFVIVLSSDLIAEVMNEYFNSRMFMMPVRVVDLQARESGYAFTLGFDRDELEYEGVEGDERYVPGDVLVDLIRDQAMKQPTIPDIRGRTKRMTLPTDERDDNGHGKRDERGRFVKGE